MNRILVVDDSLIYRKVVRDALSGDPELDVVGSAADGEACLQKIHELRPDVITLDIEMPVLDGLSVLRILNQKEDPPGVVLLSGCSSTNASLTTKALRLGAFDFIVKPDADTAASSSAKLKSRLLPVVKCCLEARGMSAQDEQATQTIDTADAQSLETPASCRGKESAPPEIVAIGTSTGGPQALAEVLPKLPVDFPVPLVIVQHMPPMFTRSLAEELDNLSKIRVVEAEDGMPLEAGSAYIAPGGRQMKILPNESRAVICINDDPPVGNCRPAVDYLFDSLASVFEGKVLAVVMTGMGNDGTASCQTLAKQGARIIAQDEASCTVFGMPGQIVKAGIAVDVCPLHELPNVITSSCGGPGQ